MKSHARSATFGFGTHVSAKKIRPDFGFLLLLPADQQTNMPVIDGTPLSVVLAFQWARLTNAWFSNAHRSEIALHNDEGDARNKIRRAMKFTELVRLLESNGCKVIKKKGSIRYYAKPGWDRLVKLGPLGTCRPF